MADLSSLYGEDPQDLQKVLAQLKALEEVKGELDAKERALGESERGTTAAIRDNTGALDKAIEATRQLANETGTLTTSLGRETEALRANSEAWTQQVALMRQAATATERVGGTTGTSRVSTPRVARTPTVAEAAPFVAEERARRAETMAYPTPQAHPGPSTAMHSYAAQLAQAQEAERRVATPVPRMLPAATPSTIADASAARDALAAEGAEAERVAKNFDTATAAGVRLAAAQKDISISANENMAAFAGLDSRLSRNGALTTEFIQALARGNVTMEEFGSQMTSTIGKFGGWAIAGAAVYGVADALKQVGTGAAQTQEGVQNLSRFIPSTRSGSSREDAESTFRNISTQFNLPISDVTSAMTVMARVFHNVADAGNAARAVLLATRLDSIPQAQSEQYLVGTGTSLGFTKGSQLVGVVDSLNALQNQFGARVSQTLPGIARAAPAAVAGGVSAPMLEALVGAAVRSGVPGAQAGTAILRSISTFAFRPASENTFRQFGIQPEQGHYGDLINQIVQRITDPKPGKELTQTNVKDLALALGGPLLGGRTLLPLLENARLIPEMTAAASNPPSAQAELDKVLGGVGEQAKRLGIELQNIGSELESAGILTPVELLLKAFGDLGGAIEIAIGPFKTVGQVVSQLPGPFKDIIGIAAGAAALRYARGTDFGFATQTALSRLPGLSGLDDERRRAIVGTRGRLQESALPIREREAEQAANRARAYDDVVQTSKDRASAAASRSAASPGDEKLAAASTDAQAEFQAVQSRATKLAADSAAAQGRMLDVQEQIAVLKSNQLSTEQRYSYLIEQNLVLEEGIQVSLKAQLDERVASAIAGVKGGSIAGVETAAGLTGQRAKQAMQGATPEEDALFVSAAAQAEDPNALQEQVTSGPMAVAEEAGAASNGGLFSRMRNSPLAALPGRALGAGAAAVESRAGGGAADLLGSAGLGLAIGGGFIGGGIGNAVSTVGVGAFLSDQFGEKLGGGIGSLADRAAKFTGVNPEGLGAEERLGAAGGNPLVGAGLALAATGAGSGGVGGLLEGAAGGAAVGFGFGGPLGAGVGAAAGAGLSLVGDLFNSKPNPNALTSAGKTLRDQISGSANSLASQVPFSDAFNQELTTAFDNGDTTQADAAQTQVQKTVRSLSQILSDSGYGTKTAYSSRASLSAAIGGAITSQGFDKDPGDVGQIIDTASQAVNTRASNYETYALAQTGTNAGAESAYTSSAAQVTGSEAAVRAAVRAQELGSTVAADRQAVTAAAARLSGSSSAVSSSSRGGGLGQTSTQTSNALAAAKAQLSQDKTRLDDANDQLKGLHSRDIAEVQGLAADVLGQIQTNISDVTSLAESATGDKSGQAAAGVSGALASLQAVKNQKGLSPQARKNDTDTAKAALNTARQSQDENSAQELQARLSLSASSIPDYEPVAGAQAALRNAKAYYERLKTAMLPGGKPAFDAAEVNAALAAQNQAAIALNDANYTYQTQIASDTAAITSAQNPAYAFGQAASQVTLGQTQLKLARNPDERLQAQAQILQGQNAAKEALQATAQGTYQVTEAQQGGDSVAQAMTGVAAADTALAQSMGPDQTLAAQQQLAQAQQTLHQALQSRILAVGALKASQTNNTLAQDSDNLAATEKALAQAVSGGYGKTTVTADKTAVGQARLQSFNDSFSQQVSTISFLQSTLQLSAQGALAQLEKLQQEKNLSVSQRQQLASAAYAIETDQDNTSLFDLAPAGSGVKVPTIYDVRNSAARERARLNESRSRDIGGMKDAAGKVTIGHAQVNTTGGALQVHDTTSHAKLDMVVAAIKSMSVGGTAIVNSSSSGNAMDRASRRVRTHAKSAGMSGS